MVFAVTSEGTKIAGIILVPGITWSLAHDVLSLCLEVADPEQIPKDRHLSLVREDAPLGDEPTQGTGATDPAASFAEIRAASDHDQQRSSRQPA